MAAAFYCSRLFLLMMLCRCCWTEERTSVKKELRNPNKWAGSGLAEEEEVEPVKGIYLDEKAQLLGTHLREIGNEELGVTALQGI